jgi:hypothetical protein
VEREKTAARSCEGILDLWGARGFKCMGIDVVTSSALAQRVLGIFGHAGLSGGVDTMGQTSTQNFRIRRAFALDLLRLGECLWEKRAELDDPNLGHKLYDLVFDAKVFNKKCEIIDCDDERGLCGHTDDCETAEMRSKHPNIHYPDGVTSLVYGHVSPRSLAIRHVEFLFRGVLAEMETEWNAVRAANALEELIEYHDTRSKLLRCDSDVAKIKFRDLPQIQQIMKSKQFEMMEAATKSSSMFKFKMSLALQSLLSDATIFTICEEALACWAATYSSDGHLCRRQMDHNVQFSETLAKVVRRGCAKFQTRDVCNAVWVGSHFAHLGDAKLFVANLLSLEPETVDVQIIESEDSGKDGDAIGASESGPESITGSHSGSKAKGFGGPPGVIDNGMEIETNANDNKAQFDANDNRNSVGASNAKQPLKSGKKGQGKAAKKKVVKTNGKKAAPKKLAAKKGAAKKVAPKKVAAKKAAANKGASKKGASKKAAPKKTAAKKAAAKTAVGEGLDESDGVESNEAASSSRSTMSTATSSKSSTIAIENVDGSDVNMHSHDKDDLSESSKRPKRNVDVSMMTPLARHISKQPNDAVVLADVVSGNSERFFWNRDIEEEEKGELSRWFDAVLAGIREAGW